MPFNPMTGMFEEDTKFGPSDLLMAQPEPTPDKLQELKQLLEKASPKNSKPAEYDSLDTLQDVGYEAPTKEQIQAPGFQAASKYLKNSTPIVGTKAAELLGAYKSTQDGRSPASEELTLEEAPAQSSLQDTVSLLEQYKKLTQQKQDTNRNLDLLMGGNQIAQAIASGYGGKIGDGSEAVNQLRKSAELPVEGLLGQSKAADTQTELEMADANSDISKFARERAIANAAKMGLKDEDLKRLENMSAKQLEKLGLFKNDTAAQTRANQLRFERITGADGITRTVAINSQTGEVVKDIGQSGFASQFRIHPETGNLIALSASSPSTAPIGVTGGKAGPTERTITSPAGETTKAEYSSPTSLNKVNPNLYKEFKKTQDEFTKDMKESREATTAVTNLNQKLAPGKVKIDSGMLGGIQTQAAKLAGQKGVLTDQDLVKFAGAGGVPAGMSRFFSGNFEGEMTAEDIKFFREFSQNMSKAVAQDIQDRSQVYTKQIQNEAKDYLPGLQDSDVQKWLQVDQIAPAVQKGLTSPENKVRIKLPNGTTGLVPKDKLQDALQRGAVEVK